MLRFWPKKIKSNPEKQQALAKSTYRPNPDEFKVISIKLIQTDKFKALFKKNTIKLIQTNSRLSLKWTKIVMLALSLLKLTIQITKRQCANERNKYVASLHKSYSQMQHVMITRWTIGQSYRKVRSHDRAAHNLW